MMGHLDAKDALCQFFRDSRDVLDVEKANLVSVPAPPKNRNKRKLPTESISNDDVATAKVEASCAVAPATKKTKLYAPICNSIDQPTPPVDPPHSFGKFMSLRSFFFYIVLTPHQMRRPHPRSWAK